MAPPPPPFTQPLTEPELDNPYNECEFVRFAVPDVHGLARAKTLSAAAIHPLQERGGLGVYSGMVCMGVRSALAELPGVGDRGQPDVIAVPQKGTFKELPWAGWDSKHEKKERRIGMVICNTKWKPEHGGEWQGACTRAVACKQLNALREMGYSLYSALEYEFRLLDMKSLDPVIQGVDFCGTLATSQYDWFLHDLMANLNSVGVQTEAMNAEYGSSQFEITLEPAYGLEAADRAFVYKNGIKEMAQQRGFVASFMTKPYLNETGNSGHYNHSLLDKDGNSVFFDPQTGGLSQIARYWIGGLIQHSPAITALCAPTVNCYRRLHSPWAPTVGNWGNEYRYGSFRYKVSPEGKSAYFENRIGGSGANPYLVMAATVAAGVSGIKNKIEPPPEFGTEGIPLPKNLSEALAALEWDDVIRGALGEEFVKWFVIVKRMEINEVVKDQMSPNSQMVEERKYFLRHL